MPIYEYQCQSCGHQFELLQKISDEPVKICPECGKSSVQQLVSAAGFQLKGSGWYVTDFRDSNKKPATADIKKESAGKTKREKKAKKVDTKSKTEARKSE